MPRLSTASLRPRSFSFARYHRFMSVLTLTAALLLLASDGSSTEELREAVAKVQRENSGKILSAHTVTSGRQRLHRIKLLTEDGSVRVRTVPAGPGPRNDSVTAPSPAAPQLPRQPAPQEPSD